MSSTQNQSFLSWLVKAYATQVAPVLNDAITSTLMFLQLMSIDPKAAGPYGAKAIATLVAGGVCIWMLWKSLRGLNVALKRLAALLEVLWVTLEAQQAFFRSRLGQVTRRLIDRLAQPDAVRNLVDWLAVLPRSTMRAMLKEPDGAVAVATQRNFGLLLLGISTASGLAFVTAVVTTAGSWSPEPTLLWPAALVAGTVYMVVILAIERAIVAPVFTIGGGWRAMVAALGAVAVRVALAWLIASFTALPITALLLRGGIVESRESSVEDQRKALRTQIETMDGQILEATRQRRSSTACKDAQAAVTKAQGMVVDAASSGCRAGVGSCPGPLTAKAEAIQAARATHAEMACQLTATELKVFSDARQALTARLSDLPAAKSPDILISATVLNTMVRGEEGSFFQPVRSTFRLLLGLELAPALLKLARELLKFASRTNGKTKRSSAKPGTTSAKTFRISGLRRERQTKTKS